MYRADGSLGTGVIQNRAPARSSRRKQNRPRRKQVAAAGTSGANIIGDAIEAGSNAILGGRAANQTSELAKAKALKASDEINDFGTPKPGNNQTLQEFLKKTPDDYEKQFWQASKDKLVTMAKNGDGDAIAFVIKMGDKKSISQVMKGSKNWKKTLMKAGYTAASAGLIVGLAFLLPKALKALAQSIGDLFFPCASPEVRGAICCWVSVICSVMSAGIAGYLVYTSDQA